MHTLESTLARINTNRTNAKDTRQLDTITSLTEVYELVVNTDRNRVRCLTRRYRIGGLLELDNLLVLEGASVVNDQHRILGLADLTRTLGGLTNLATVKANVDRVVADIATEESVFHVRDNRRCSDDHAFDTNKAIHICYVLVSRSNVKVNVTYQKDSGLAGW
jgi:hypothetical protein